MAHQPESYLANTPEEQIVIAYVDSFRKQFGQLYPHRPELLLFPMNECNIPVSTTQPRLGISIWKSISIFLN